MPKRSAQSRIERYERKIRKLTEKEKRRKIRSPFDSSSETDNEGNGRPDPQDKEDEFVTEPVLTTTPDVWPEADQGPLGDPEPKNDQSSINQQDEAPADSDLDPELLSALGETMSDSPDYGENIHDNLSKLWLPLLKKGMPPEIKEKILRDYLVPDNCKLLQAPKLNAEISAAVPDMVRNRDKTVAASQQQLGLGITAINRGMDILLKSDDKVQAMKHLSNGCRILCDSHNLVTNNRVKLITPSLDKSIVHMINESERDETLFGSSLSEKIKAAKAIEKQGLQIKKPVQKPKPAGPQASTRPTSFQGNWAGPPRYPQANRGGRGGYRKPQPLSVARRPYNAPATQPHRAAASEKSRVSAQNHR